MAAKPVWHKPRKLPVFTDRVNREATCRDCRMTTALNLTKYSAANAAAAFIQPEWAALGEHYAALLCVAAALATCERAVVQPF